MNKALWIGVIVTLLLVSIFWYFSEKQRYPECFLTDENECNKPYDKEPMFYKNDKLIQCCRKPHYMLQGIDVIEYCFYFKQDILDKNITGLSKY